MGSPHTERCAQENFGLRSVDGLRQGLFGQNAYSSDDDVNRSVFSMLRGTLITTESTSVMLPTMRVFSADVDSV